MSADSILLVDDDEIQHRVMEKYLGLSGYQLRHAMNGVEAIDLCKESMPDLLVLDIQMPKMDGFQTLAALRRLPGGDNASVIVLSSLSVSHLKVKALEMGAEDYVEKPFQPAELLARIKRSLSRGRQVSRKEHCTQGSLADIPLVDLLQTLSLSQKSGDLHLLDVGAHFSLASGFISAGRYREFTGVDAYNRILFLAHGEYKMAFQASPESDDALEPLSVTLLIMDALTIIDEAERSLNKVPKDQLYAPAEGADMAPEWDAFDSRWPLPARDVVAAFGGDLRNNAARVSEAINAEILVAV